MGCGSATSPAAPSGSWEPSLAWGGGAGVREAATLLGAFPVSQCEGQPRQRGESGKEKRSALLGGSGALGTQDGPRVSFSLPGLMLGQAEDWQRFLCWCTGAGPFAPLFGKVGTSCTGMGVSRRVLRAPGSWTAGPAVTLLLLLRFWEGYKTAGWAASGCGA